MGHRPLLVLPLLAFAWLAGIAVAALTDAEAPALVATASLIAAAAFAYRPRASTLAAVALAAALALLAGWRYEASGGVDTSLARYNDSGEAVRLRGVISEEPEERETSVMYRIDVREVFDGGGWRPQTGRVLLRGPVAPRYEYGDLLEVGAELETPPSFPDFDYREYLLRRGITSLAGYARVEVVAHDQASGWRSALIGVRSSLSDALADVLPEPNASLAAGILYGQRSSIPDSLRDDMATTGTSHLVAVSGQNVTIVAALVIAALAWLIGRKPAAWFSLASIVAYAVFVGGSPSVVRAAIMGAVYVGGVILGRQQSAWVALLLAGGAMTALDPQVVNEVSFQLSFAATLGLTTLAPLLRERIDWQILRRPSLAPLPGARSFSEMFAVTLAAVIFTLPITAATFGRVSLIAPVANLFVVPAFVAVAATSAVAAAVELAVPGAGSAVVWLAWPPAEYMIEAVRFFATAPGASVEIGGVEAWHAFSMYMVIGAATWWLARRPAEKAEPPKLQGLTVRALIPAGGLVALVAIGAAVVALAFARDGSERLSVTFLDIGQGDAILIEGPDGNRVLVDGGPGGQPIDEALSRNLPFDSRRIDMVVMTHPQADHMAGLIEVLDRYDVRAVLDIPLPCDSALCDAWHDSLATSGANVRQADRGQAIDLGGGAVLRVLAPDADDPLLPVTATNSGSTVLRLEMGEASFLLTGDLDEAGEQALIRSGTDLRATVLKVGHHGSTTSTSPAFLARVGPSIDVISVGAGNPFGHPRQDVLGRLAGDAVYRTDADGDVTVSTDGERIWVETAR